MHSSRLPFVLCAAPLAALLPAQEPFAAPRANAAAIVTTPPTGLVTDIDADGRIWVAGDTYKAAFDSDGTTFIPRLGADAPRNLPAHLQRAKVTIGGTMLPSRPAAPTLANGFVAFTGEGLVERYRLDGAGIEQQFVLPWLPNRGAIEVAVPVDTECAVLASGRGHRFQHELGSFEYGRAVAIDAAGRRLDLETHWNGHAFVITVPEAFVAGATLPLLIDPLLGTVTSLASDTRRLEQTDIAFDDTLGVFAVCWERVFSATDHDVYLQYLDGNMDPIGNAVAVDLSTTTWRRPRLAGLNAHDRFLVVAEVGAGNVSPFHVGGRLCSGATPTQGAQFTIAQTAGFDMLAPDVGGDPATSAGSFCVTYQTRLSAIDSDIFARRVAMDGTLGPVITIDAGLANDQQPVLSKGCGASGGYEQWAVVFQRQLGNGTCQPMFATISRGGSLATAPTTWASPILATGAQLTVSSASDVGANRRFLAAYAVDGNPGAAWQYFALDIYGQTVATSGFYFSNSTHVPGLDVDCDGTRYALCRTGLLQSGTSFVDTYLLAIVGSAIVVQDAVSTTAVLGSYRAGSVVSRRTGGDSLNPLHGLAWLHDELAGTFRVQAQHYQGRQVGDRLVIRQTGCGIIGSFSSANLIPGGTVTISLSAPSGILGMLAGFPVDIPIGPCPGCRQGADGNTIFGNTLSFTVPQNAVFVGTTVSVQPFLIVAPGTGTCLGQVVVGDTIDMTVR